MSTTRYRHQCRAPVMTGILFLITASHFAKGQLDWQLVDIYIQLFTYVFTASVYISSHQFTLEYVYVSLGRNVSTYNPTRCNNTGHPQIDSREYYNTVQHDATP